MQEPTPQEGTHEKTLDLAALAEIDRGDRVEVGRVFDATDELFQKTIKLVSAQRAREEQADEPPPRPRERLYVPEHQDLRSVFLFAEALGGYEALHDLINAHSPRWRASRRYKKKAQTSPLSEGEIQTLEQYRAEITSAMGRANEYLHSRMSADFTADEIRELYEILILGRQRAQEISEIIGIHLAHEIQRSLERLYRYLEMIQSVEQTVSGIFLVDSEVMFIPPNELISCVNTIFRGVGNPYVAKNVDGVMLLAARNLLIQVVSFYSYYGKHQIYNLFEKGHSAVNVGRITYQIRREIGNLFAACREGNKLVLTRIMRDAEREFELSVEAIQQAAERSAVEAVKRFLPPPEPAPRVEKPKSLFRRILSWFKSGR